METFEKKNPIRANPTKQTGQAAFKMDVRNLQ